jgi:hypothetical protein
MDIIGDADGLDPARSGPEPAGWRALAQPADLLHAVVDGLVALGAAVVAAMLSVVILLYGASFHFYGGPGDFFAVGVWLTGLSLGVPLRETNSATVPGGHVLATASAAEGRAIAWLLAAIVLVLLFRLVRRRERAQPSAGGTQLAVRALLTALVVTLVLLVLALVTTRASVFGTSFSSVYNAGLRSSSSIGLEPGLVFAGPLLLSAVAALTGAATATALPPRAVGQLARWRPVFRLAWRQVVVIGAVTGVTLLVYVSAETTKHSGGRETAVTVLALLLLLPNLAIYGTLGGFGTTFYSTARVTGLGPGHGTGASDSIGIFGSFRPWIVWLMLAAAVAGTLLPALLARRAVRAERIRGADYPLSGVWRATVTGLVAALGCVLLGAFSYTTSSATLAGFHRLSFHQSDSAGPSLLAAAGLTAAWLSLGYLATAIAVRGRVDR